MDIRFRCKLRSRAKQVKKVKVKDSGNNRQNKSKRLAPYNVANEKTKRFVAQQWLPNSSS